ncbi:zf-HC2 domain-containing protein [Saccharothrix deserti]|uniref:zf-HC2 domain-containing protein n=1 Tax=Saccharothrix deserti TaxID=2593674 RepID=UPI00131A82AE|nr:zf-HC2 domain-containing protein [Saccharothrix deserti]
MTTHACPHTITVGGYLLGILLPQERDEFRGHAEACPHCRQAIDELKPSARLLDALKAGTRRAAGSPVFECACVPRLRPGSRTASTKAATRNDFPLTVRLSEPTGRLAVIHQAMVPSSS